MPPRVNFYLLPQNTETARCQFACRLADKLLRGGHGVQLHAATEEEARELDALLWSYPAEGFVPHTLADGSPPAAATAVITWGDQQALAPCLLNLATAMPPFPERFETIAEFVLNDEAARALSRQLWNDYRQRGFELQHHQM